MENEVEELANELQGFVIEEGDLLKGKVFKVLSANRCHTIAECLIAKGYRLPTREQTKEVVWPERMKCFNLSDDYERGERNGYNSAIDACKKSYEDSLKGEK